MGSEGQREEGDWGWGEGRVFQVMEIQPLVLLPQSKAPALPRYGPLGNLASVSSPINGSNFTHFTGLL